MKTLLQSEEILAFLKAAGWRAFRTFCQTAAASITTGALIKDVDWIAVLSASAVAAILSFLTSIATGLPEAPIDVKE